jgi:hypothetical protein
MYELKQAAVARAIDVLRGGPLTAAAFAVKMWPDRVVGRTPGQHSKMGHAFLQRLGQLNYVERVGDLWMVRRFGGDTGGAAGDPSKFAPPVAPPVGLPGGLPTWSPAGSPTGLVNGQAALQPEQLRLTRLVGQATEPVPTVTHDAAFGDIAIRGAALDGVLVEACAIVVLSGRRMNVYPPFAPHMLVGLAPAEGARALYLRWQQSGAPPELARPGAWITVEDGIVAAPSFWRPADAPAGWFDQEDVRTRIGRQRRAAGLA